MRIRHKIYGADEFGDDMDVDLMDEDADLDDKLDSISDDIDDMQDDIDDIEEDEPDIETEINIENHYIAQCDRCDGIFISAVIESDQEVEKISGVCPLCGEETDQYLKWVVKPID